MAYLNETDEAALRRLKAGGDDLTAMRWAHLRAREARVEFEGWDCQVVRCAKQA